jgi:hypothetical protein
MHQFASGPPAGLSLTGEEPPLSPETVGRSGNAFAGAPVALKPMPTIALTRAVKNPDSRRLVLRLLGGEELELATFEEHEEAMTAAAALVAQLAAAETSGDWPEVDGRFLRPGSIASVDVLPAE